MLYQDQNDETLVMLTLAGEQRAYEVLVARHEKTVIAAAKVITHNQFMAEDAAQDAFVTAWMKLNILCEPNKFRAWVCRIAKNCAKNMITRYRGFLSLDALKNCILENEHGENPQTLYTVSEEKEMLHKSIGNMPEKVKQIIQLHYFEGLSIAEIADKMRISAGTVKWQLHDGRKRIRMELCAMNEDLNDSLVQRVMKKIEELKLWQLKNSKSGFEAVYKDVLREVEELPESIDKHHALADVLMRGWWWLPGDKNDALFARIREAAERGKNDEVMQFIVSREDSLVYDGGKIDFIRDKQIPRLEAGGFAKSFAHEWFWLGCAYFENNEPEKGLEAYKKVLSILTPSDMYYAYAHAAIEMEKKHHERYAAKNERDYRLRAVAEEYRFIDGKLRRWNQEWLGKGYLCSADLESDFIFRNASYCDGNFAFDGMSVGETHIGSDGTKLTFAEDRVKVETPCGKFDNCQLWITKHKEATYKTYFKKGVGIVKQERKCDGLTETRLLKSYNIIGGSGYIPCHAGNTWEYTAEYNPEVIQHASKIVMHYADDKKVIVSQNFEITRLKYDDNSWLDMILQVRNDYCRMVDGQEKICDVSYPMKRAEILAKTPMEKAHTKAACSVVRRILATDPGFNPNCTETGHWNFFERRVAARQERRVVLSDNFRWSFEWKNIGSGGIAEEPLLYNDIYGILQDAVNCIWSDDWKIGASIVEEFILWGTYPIKTKVYCEEAGEVTTKAGTFQNCMKISLDISGFSDGLAYRGGKKEYIFAPGVGIVRTVNNYCKNTLQAVYELTAFEGTGEGYMPICDGMTRRYDAQNLTDGYIGSVEYSYVADDEGNIVIFADRCGIKRKIGNITQYSSIMGEVMEEELWQQGKHDESRLRHDINNFNLLLHFLGRPPRYWGAPQKAVAWNKYRMSICESLGEGRGVPPAWLGFYASTCFRTACALFGCGEKEEGYKYLDRAFELFPKWAEIPDGELLEVGNEQIFAGIKVVKGKGLIELPDGKREPLQYSWLFDDSIGLLYYGMTAPHGWEWFNGVRNEERFKAAIERARKLMENK